MIQEGSVLSCYDATAKEYSNKFLTELDSKPFDRMILTDFALAMRDKARILDLGCGPGQTTKYIFDLGVTKVTGIDLSSGMIKKAQENFPQINFEVGDMLHLHKIPDASVDGIIAFYSVVHFDYPELSKFLIEVSRILKEKGKLIFSCYAEEKEVAPDEFLGQKINLKWYFYDTEKVVKLVTSTPGLQLQDCVTRYPYPSEHQAKRTYITIEKISLKK